MLDPRPAIRAVARDVAAGVAVGAVAARFHRGLVEATARACVLAADRHGLDRVVLSGGAFQNRILLAAHAPTSSAPGCGCSCP